MTGDPFAAAAASAARLVARAGRHDVAVVLGSGWTPAADAIGAADAEIPLAELGGFPEPTVAGHAPAVRSVGTGPLRALVFLGRVHLYEGLPPSAVVHGVRTAVAAGCRAVVLTNAAGGIRPGLVVGQPVLISDHLNLTGASPLAGPPPSAGPRFVDLTGLYSPRLRALARDADPSLAEGVYAMLPGPQYETPAEITMLGRLGADLVGMSTVLEAIAARQLGAEVLGISLVTNLAAGLAGHGLSHAEVVEAGRASASRMGALLAAILPNVLPPAPALVMTARTSSRRAGRGPRRDPRWR
ncbi:MAG TPA: purine-nucleoside phosphorylase [Streptosporangiaceae bacterium]|nr:purine-nucleoside phosphorylase [Streptosporangiaceae bacterium]